MSSDDPFRDEPNPYRDVDAQSEPSDVPPRKKGMSLAMKIMLALLAVFGGALLVCCGGAFFLFRPTISEDPETIIAMTREIAQIDIPEEFDPRRATSQNVIVAQFTSVLYKLPRERGLLTLMEIVAPEEISPEQEEDLMQRMREQHVPEVRRLRTTESETRTFAIADREVEFTFSEAVDQREMEFRQVTGTFPSRNGLAYLLIQAEAEALDEEQIVAIIESIEVE